MIGKNDLLIWSGFKLYYLGVELEGLDLYIFLLLSRK